MSTDIKMSREHANKKVGKYKINLLQAEILPKKALLTLANVGKIWLFVLVVMLAWAGMSQYEMKTLNAQHYLLVTNNNHLSEQLANLETKIKQHKPDSRLVHQLATLKLLIANKAALHQKLIDDHESYISGFARAMTDLSKIDSRDISLSEFTINQDEITFSGMARSAEAVPIWLAKFEQSEVLSNKEFSHFSLQENKKHFIDFTVSTDTKAKQRSAQGSMRNNGRKGVSQ